MPVYQFIRIPKLPPEIADQSRLVQLVKYCAQEGQQVDSNAPIAIVENWWAIIQINAPSKGYLTKTFFTPSTSIRIGDPIAIITSDGEDVVHDQAGSEYSLLEIKRQKPIKSQQ